MDAAAQWPQEVGLVKPMEERDSPTCSRPLMEKRLRPQKDHLNCPRCNSTSTKFCYYNNYSLTQPRHFCKTCRRYWTEGGSLRNVPVGGGSRKNKRSSSSSSSGSSKKAPDLTPPNGSLSSSQNPKTYQGQDLNLAFQTTQDYSSILESVQLPNIGNNSNNNTAASSPPPSSSLSALELLSGVSSRGLNSFMSMPLAAMPNTIAVNPSGFGLHDLKPTLSFPWYGSIQGVQGSSGRLLFPHEDLKLVPNTGFEQNKGQGDASGYWNGMLGGGSW